MKQAFKKMDSVRRQSEPKDTVKNLLTKSPREIIYSPTKTEFLGIKQVLAEVVRFRHTRYLNLTVKAALAQPVMVNEQNKLYIVSAGQMISLSSIGRTGSKGTEKRNVNELQLVYSLPEDDFKLLSSQKVTSVKIDYDGGEWVLNLDVEGSEKIKKICMQSR
ncbi:MAG: hypothetical protein AAGC65_01735 [Mucilaginibacter sp.]|uniref:hypothetical protein n=1 Tax=Mucilaginibacter sp. TaxID=1882438 RepID=UPI0031B0CFAA